MSETIDIKTRKQIEPEIKEIKFDRGAALDILTKSTNIAWDNWIKFQQNWTNKAYATFNDYDKYLILIYLFKKVFQAYSDKFSHISMNEFYSKKTFVVDRINLIQISSDLHIPKENIRRKINEFQNSGILSRQGKSIILNKASIDYQKPETSVSMLSSYISKRAEELVKQNVIEKSVTASEIENFINKYFAICWLTFFRLQIPLVISWRDVFGDLETWRIWACVNINHQISFSKNIKKNKVEDKSDFKVYFDTIQKEKPPHGLNASSISDITFIPRATVIRKLKWLIKNESLKKNKKLEYLVKPNGKINKIMSEQVKANQLNVAEMVVNFLDLMKNSNFKI